MFENNIISDQNQNYLMTFDHQINNRITVRNTYLLTRVHLDLLVYLGIQGVQKQQGMLNTQPPFDLGMSTNQFVLSGFYFEVLFPAFLWILN